MILSLQTSVYSEELKEFIKEYYEFHTFNRKYNNNTYGFKNDTYSFNIKFTEEEDIVWFNDKYYDETFKMHFDRYINIERNFFEVFNRYKEEVLFYEEEEIDFNTDDKYQDLVEFINNLQEKFEQFKLKRRLEKELK